MSTTIHTPDAWIVSRQGKDFRGIHKANGEIVVPLSAGLSHANANRIAAFPDMYEALNCFLRKGLCEESIQKANIAVRKADGAK